MVCDKKSRRAPPFPRGEGATLWTATTARSATNSRGPIIREPDLRRSLPNLPSKHTVENRIPEIPIRVHKDKRNAYRIRRRHDRRTYGQGEAASRRGQAGVAKRHAVPGRTDPEAAAELPADDPGADEHLHAAPEHPRFLPLRPGRATAANPPADGPAVDGAGPTAATNLPAAGSRAAAVLPADDPGGAWQLLAAIQYPPLLRQGGP